MKIINKKLCPQEVACILQVTRSTLLRWKKEGKLVPAHIGKVSRLWVYEREQIENFIDGRDIKANCLLGDEWRKDPLVESLTYRYFMRLVHKSIGCLSPREKKVLLLRFKGNCTLEQAGKELSVTRERIRQLEVLALRKLRKSMEIRSQFV